jgi:CRP-like cAMP-binding protein
MIDIMSLSIFDRLAALASGEVRYGPGETAFRQGDPVAALHLVKVGEIRLIRHLPNGLALTLHRARPGAVLAEASLFSPAYHCDAVATGPASTLSIPKNAVTRLMRNDAVFAADWAIYLAHEVQSARLRSEILALRTVAERLDAWLAANGGCLPAKGNWKSVAAEIAVSPEALYRELGRRTES